MLQQLNELQEREVLSSNLSREEVAPPSDPESQERRLQKEPNGHVAFLDSAYAQAEEQMMRGGGMVERGKKELKPFTQEFLEVEARLDREGPFADFNQL